MSDSRTGCALALALLGCLLWNAPADAAPAAVRRQAPVQRPSADRVEDYQACIAGSAPGCGRFLNDLRAAEIQAIYDGKCNDGATQACVLLAAYFLNVARDGARADHYQSLALSQMHRDGNPAHRAAAAAIDREMASLPRRR
jgi:hypothetical protein